MNNYSLKFQSHVINMALGRFDRALPFMSFIISYLCTNLYFKKFINKKVDLYFFKEPIKDYIPYWQSIYSYCWIS
jgi:hypothetical protein